jgi:ATP adenylyltransferase
MNYFFNFDKMEYVRGKRPSGCILCLIRDGSEEVVDLTVYRDQHFTITVNLYPYNPGHVMIFPNRHITDIREFTAEEVQRVHQLTTLALATLEETHHPAAFNMGYNMGPAAGASIDHLHLHLIPRYPRETGIADLVAGKRVLVEDPRVTSQRIAEAMAARIDSGA